MLHVMNIADVINYIFIYHSTTAHRWAKASSLSRIHDHTQTHHTR